LYSLQISFIIENTFTTSTFRAVQIRMKLGEVRSQKWNWFQSIKRTIFVVPA